MKLPNRRRETARAVEVQLHKKEQELRGAVIGITDQITADKVLGIGRGNATVILFRIKGTAGVAIPLPANHLSGSSSQLSRVERELN